MAKRKHTTLPADLFHPEALPAIDPERFGFIFEFASASSDKTAPTNPFRDRGDAKPGPGEIMFSDIPLNRFAFSVKEQFGDDIRGYASFMSRWFALLDLTQDERMARWNCKSDEIPGLIAVHPAVFDVIASAPFQKDLKFDADEVFAMIERRARELEDED